MAGSAHRTRPGARSLLFRTVTWLLAAGCFYLVYTRIEAAAQRDGLTAVQYLARFFRDADWTLWLALMGLWVLVKRRRG